MHVLHAPRDTARLRVALEDAALQAGLRAISIEFPATGGFPAAPAAHLMPQMASYLAMLTSADELRGVILVLPC